MSRRNLGWVGWLLLPVLPWLGVRWFGDPHSGFWSFPPGPVHLDHPGADPWVVAGLLAGFALFLGWMARVLIRAWPGNLRPARRFPWWGWAALAALAAGWILAWTRFPWFAPLQPHTYPMIWFPFTILLQGVAWWISGTCLMRRCPVFFASLYGVSAVFWWFFEYLNRFVENWSYVNVDGFSGPEYAFFATIAFATVLPGVGGMYEVLCGLWRVKAWPVFGTDGTTESGARAAGYALLAVGVVSLALIGVFPFVLFPLVWIGPLVFIEGWWRAAGRPPLLAVWGGGGRGPSCVESASRTAGPPSLPGALNPTRTAMPRLVLMMLAALLCGVCWELWNVGSLAHWVYHVPYAKALHVFEMPLAGYAGYLPFGVQCVGMIGVLESCGPLRGRTGMPLR